MESATLTVNSGELRHGVEMWCLCMNIDSGDRILWHKMLGLMSGSLMYKYAHLRYVIMYG